MNFENLYINLTGETFASLAKAKAVGTATVNYGVIINAFIHSS
ncbi:hypothetical protein ACFS6F_06260 [Halobacillus naozhouensis]